MAKYVVRIEEILAKCYVVEADSYGEAEEKISNAYSDGEIDPLTYEDYDDVNFKPSYVFGENEVKPEDGDVEKYYEVLKDKGE